ncbi:hypothetical protein P171DRAFT_510939 [Karstenula rhodostoma CBS 690.94]|uniref:Uncharacterized protein n=1 Tax=Karstenula rhodostoma CBS 690.94 TaxID=1392251 RepID=A0A9P4PMS6_9PLEO|nr:hypothetical protein P171DRAFT_510939 [Karstenula rhodostoma CBS 690.94]
MRDKSLINIVFATQLADETWSKSMEHGESLRSAMKGVFVPPTQVNFNILKPVPGVGAVGVHCTLVERKDNTMGINAVMKDGQGTPLVQA